MKKVILNVALAAVFMIVSAGVFAQSATPTTPPQGGTPATQAQPPRKIMTPEEKADRQLMGLTKRLDLTDAQKPKVKEVLVNDMKQQDADQKSAAGDKDKMMSLRKSREDNKKAALKKILTPEQFEKYNAPRPQPKPNPAQGAPAQTPPPAGK